VFAGVLQEFMDFLLKFAGIFDFSRKKCKFTLVNSGKSLIGQTLVKL
jgi:hypothetical protein